MLRLLPLLALALLPAAVAAPVPPGGRVAFGTNGLLTNADLEKVHFDSQPVKDGEKFAEAKPAKEDEVEEAKGDGPAKPRPKNRYDVAVHMPWAKFREGEPIPAYFVLRNNRASTFSLDARLSLFGPEPMIWNSCRIDVRDAKTGEPVHVISRAGWSCGGGGLVDVPADGFYCVKGDVGSVADGKPLPPGEYEVDWRYGGLRSAPTRFSVLKLDGAKIVARPNRPALRFFHVVPEYERDEQAENAGEPFHWRDCQLDTVRAEDMAAALAVGQHGVLVPDVHTIPVADKLVEARVEWKPYRDGDRVVVTLRAVPPYERVRFEEVPQLHLQIESEADERLKWMMEEQAKQGDRKRNDATLVTPLTIEARLPADWRERCGVTGTARVAVLVVAKPVELPRGGRAVEQLKRVEKVCKASAGGRGDPPVWSGIVRTDITELRFPPPTPAP